MCEVNIIPFLVFQGDSPYDRATYRYSPILAWLLRPNILWSHIFGKVLFIQCDILTGALIYLIVKQTGYSHKTALYCSWLWLFNPLPITVSTRGNAESIMSVLVLTSIYYIIKRERSVLITGSVLYGLSVHLKIYPITYALPMYLFLQSHNKEPFKIFGLDILPNLNRLKLSVISATVFLLSTGISYH